MRMDTTDENPPNIIRKKSSFLRDDSYRIFHIARTTIVQHEQIPMNDFNRNELNKSPPTSMKIWTKHQLYIRRKEALIDIQPKLYSDSHRRRIACGTVLLALILIIIIMLYVIIMTVQHIHENSS